MDVPLILFDVRLQSQLTRLAFSHWNMVSMVLLQHSSGDQSPLNT